MKKAMQWLKGEPVLAISAVLALASCLVVLPDKEYLGYVDGRVLALLYCLMAVVAGMEQAGAFRRMAAALVKRSGSGKGLCLVLVMLCFFSSMLVTNDVALITFVPFAVLVLAASGQGGLLPWVVSLQTVAANLGSMLTPVGNPQNLYLYSRYGFSAGEFFALTVPATLASLVVLVVLCLLTPARRVTLTAQNEEGPMTPRQRAQLILCGVLFCVCLASVFHLLPWPALLAAVIVALAVFDRKLVLGADFALLVTFVCFFVFAGNLARIPALQNFLASVMQGREMLVGAAASQVISNVPAAVLLSGFTENGAGLLMGVDLGGLGTPHCQPGQPDQPEDLFQGPRRQHRAVSGGVQRAELRPAGGAAGTGRLRHPVRTRKRRRVGRTRRFFCARKGAVDKTQHPVDAIVAADGGQAAA